MLDVLIALVPAIIASSIIFGARALLLIGVTAAACVAFEYLYCYLMKKPIPIGDLSAVVTGVLLAFNMPSTMPLWMAIIGAFVSIVIVKQMFGGLGHNFANPAIVGRIVLSLSFAARMVIFSGVRKRLEDAEPPKAFEGLPITLVAASITSLSFTGFGGLIEKIFGM